MPRLGLVRGLAVVGPGLAIAATGVGAGDMIAATVAGSRYGLAIVWAAVLGALFLPFLAATLPYLNGSARRVGALKNGPLTIALLSGCLALFAYLAYDQIGGVVETVREFFRDVG